MAQQYLLICFIVLAYSGVFVVFRRRGSVMLGGIEYLLAGLLFSAAGISAEAMKPLLHAFVGWIGVVTGMQFKVQYLRRLDRQVPKDVLRYGVPCAGGALALSAVLIGSTHAAYCAAALVPVSYVLAAARAGAHRYTLFFVSMLPLAAVGCLLAVQLVLHTAWFLPATLLLMVTCAIIARFVLSTIDEPKTMPLVLIGLIVLISESCAAVGVSALVVTFGVGVYLANFCRMDNAVFATLLSDEKPLYSMFLLLSGFAAGFLATPAVLLKGAALAGGVALVKLTVLRLAGTGVPRSLWPLLLAPGGFALAIAIDSWLLLGSPFRSEWFSILLLCVVGLQIVSANVVRDDET